MQEFFEFAQQDNVVAILAILAVVLMLFLFTMLVRRGYGSGSSNRNGEDDGEAVKSPLVLLLEIMGETQRTMGKTLESVVALQESQGKSLDENTKLISDVREDMKGRLQDHESAAEGRTVETLEVFREATAAMALIPASLQSIQTEVGKNHEAIKAVRAGQVTQDRELKAIQESVFKVVAKADDASMLEQVLGVVEDLKGMIELALASRVNVPVAAAVEATSPPSPLSTNAERGDKSKPPSVQPSMGRESKTDSHAGLSLQMGDGDKAG